MSSFLPAYIKRGLSGIVLLKHEFRESASGYLEITNEDVAARSATGFVIAHLYSKRNFLRRSGGELEITDEPITSSQYSQLVQGKERLDTLEVVQDTRAAEQREQLRVEIERQRDRLAPRCPRCRRRMKARIGKHGPFWGCGKFPNCRGTTPLSPGGGIDRAIAEAMRCLVAAMHPAR